MQNNENLTRPLNLKDAIYETSLQFFQYTDTNMLQEIDHVLNKNERLYLLYLVTHSKSFKKNVKCVVTSN